ncbi:MAG: MBL fold metallo-hydrolase [Clostridiales bacterium]|nr:MBL fold metallo-hydrolase [Clostridiales bacterium]
MEELIQAKGNSYYLPGITKIGVVKTAEDKAVLIDSGLDDDDGARALRALTERGWTLEAVFNTHSHADHIGGNAYLQKETGCPIFVPDLECDFVNHPILETSFFYGGFPPLGLRRQVFLAEESRAFPLRADVLPSGWEILPLPGHWFNMAGFRTADDVVYLADLLVSEQAMQRRSKIPYLVDAGAYLDTLERVRHMEAAVFVPGHADAMTDINGLVQKNIDKIYEIRNCLLDILGEPLTVDQILQRVFKEYGLLMDLAQYVLIGSTIRSYLAWLEAGGMIRYISRDDQLLWVRTKR